ncbi:MAG: hypothetical protein ACI9WT_002359, partial [Flavobacterium sp.]
FYLVSAQVLEVYYCFFLPDKTQQCSSFLLLEF